MKYNKLFIGLAVLAMGFIGSCTDEWDEHYKEATHGDGTLWQSICNNPQISNFKAVIEATGYDASLNSSQVFTVFAPTNDHFSEAERDALIQEYKDQLAAGYKGNKNSAIKEFVQNHIALYNYSSAKEAKDVNLRMMNGKFLNFGDNSFANNAYVSKNNLTNNGVLFVINNKAIYKANIFEYIKKDHDLDSVSNFLYSSEDGRRFHVEKFMPTQSVPGEIKDGKQHYLDSVTVTTNLLLNRWLGAALDDEDSTYYAVFPTNEAWKKAYDEYSTYFQYDKNVPYRDSLMYVYPRVTILVGAQFSATVNKGLAEGQPIDSVMSPLALAYQYRKLAYGSYDTKYYQFDKPFAADGIFSGTTDSVCSNGVMKKTSNWKITPRQTFLHDVIQEAEYSSSIDSLSGSKASAKPNWTSTVVTSDNPFYDKVSGNEFSTLRANTADVPFVLFDMYDVLSNMTYDLYVTTVPAYAGDTLTTDTLPTQFETTLYWHDMNGVEKSQIATSKDGGEVFSDRSVSAQGYSGTNKNVVRTDPKIVNKIKIGTYTFPTSSYGLETPQVKVKLATTIRSQKATSKIQLSNVLRIDKVELIPHVESATE